MHQVALVLVLAGLAPGPVMSAGAPDSSAASAAVRTGNGVGLLAAPTTRHS
jgi:hypothetical protein